MRDLLLLDGPEAGDRDCLLARVEGLKAQAKIESLGPWLRDPVDWRMDTLAFALLDSLRKGSKPPQMTGAVNERLHGSNRSRADPYSGFWMCPYVKEAPHQETSLPFRKNAPRAG